MRHRDTLDRIWGGWQHGTKNDRGSSILEPEARKRRPFGQQNAEVYERAGWVVFRVATLLGGEEVFAVKLFIAAVLVPTIHIFGHFIITFLPNLQTGGLHWVSIPSYSCGCLLCVSLTR